MISVEGRKRYLGLGSVDKLTLKQARELAAARATALRAANPRETAFDRLMRARYPQPTPLQLSIIDNPTIITVIPTFAEEAERMIAERRPSWKPGARTEANLRRAFEQYVFDEFGDVQIDRVSANAVQQVLRPIWHEKPDIAKKLKTGIGFVFTYALGHDHIALSPMDRVDAGLSPQRKSVKSHAAVPYDQLPALIQHCRGSDS